MLHKAVLIKVAKNASYLSKAIVEVVQKIAKN